LAGQDSLYATACVDSKTSELIIKMVNVSGKSTELDLSIEGRKISSGEINLQVLESSNLNAFNLVGKPEIVKPEDRKLKVSGKKIALNLDAHSLTVARIPLEK
jgi:alpha-L-arabinofuranosidase